MPHAPAPCSPQGERERGPFTLAPEGGGGGTWVRGSSPPAWDFDAPPFAAARPGCAPHHLSRSLPMTPRPWNRRLFARTPRTVRRAAARRRAARLDLEVLEDRAVPAVFMVNTLA